MIISEPPGDQLRLSVVGCSGSVSGPDSPASAYLVQAPWQDRQFSLLLDCGPGAFGALYSIMDPREVDAVALSHLHPDHCLDVIEFHVAGRYSPTAPWPPLDLYAPPGAVHRLARAYDPEPAEPTSAPELDLAETYREHRWQPRQQLGPFTVRTARMAHPVTAYAIRIDVGAVSLVYSGDTGPCPELIELSRDADLLLCEAGFLDRPDNPPGLHLSGRQAAEIAAEADVGRLVLTHIPPWHDADQVLAEARPHFAGPIDVARRGLRWLV